ARAATAAAAALHHATAAGAAARDAWAATDRLGVLRAVEPAELGDLATADTARGTDPPLDRPPGEVAQWWAGLSAAAQVAAIDRVPAVLGRLDGLPGWARDRANRRVLAHVLTDPRTAKPAATTARSLAARIRDEEAAGRTVQLHLLDLDGDRVALSIGDLDTAEAVAVLVPGVGTTPLDDLGRLTGDARDLASSGRTVAPGVSVATVVWLGYRTPGSPRTMTSRASAWLGGPTLAAALAGLGAARTASGQPPARTSVLAHSYGTVVVDEAADAPGPLAADAVVLLGSPGMEDTAAGLEVPEVYDATSAADPVTWPGWFGSVPRADHFGSTALPVEPGTGHSEYYVPQSPTLTALAEVVTGSRRPA
ncbi:hypothetical protein E4P40_25515, partial [Blastococcus sp. CT_GayMR20]|uniref:alpha/beta hydrolase n=1 Tax=Blastococcus sp. CT_GayMR20 TaxID=2559609 RepID=UPI001102B2A9